MFTSKRTASCFLPPASWRLPLFFLLDSGIGSTVYNPLVTDQLNGKPFLRSSEVADLAGVSTDTLRHYERKGLIPRPRRSPNGYREYPPATVDRIRLIQRALAVGFTLAELAKILKQRDKGTPPCREVRALAEIKLASVEQQLQELTALRDEFRDMLCDWDARLEQTSAGERAGLLEALVHADDKAAKRRLTVRRAIRRPARKAERP
jgi:DNA-binding transcriptional MerR regulator